MGVGLGFYQPHFRKFLQIHSPAMVEDSDTRTYTMICFYIFSNIISILDIYKHIICVCIYNSRASLNNINIIRITMMG